MGTILEIKEITKQYPGVKALSNVSMSFEEGEIHAIVGENGAGKSTLIKVICGAVSPNAGRLILPSGEYLEMIPARAKENGIGVIHQEFNLVPAMSVANNIYLGERVGGKYVISDSLMQKKTAELLKELNINIDPQEEVGNLTTGQQQLIEIAKAMSHDLRLLIMDEPSASLAVTEVQAMFKIVRKLKAKGVTVIYISHRLDEIFELCDRVSIMRDGHYVATHDIKDVSRQDLIKGMVGRELGDTFPERKNCQSDEIVLECKNLSGKGVKSVSFQLHKGELLGFSGLVGAGRTELARLIYGAEKITGGELLVKGKKSRFGTPAETIKSGIGLIPEDRKKEGFFADYEIDWNITIMSMPLLSRVGYIMKKDAENVADRYFTQLQIKAPNKRQLVKNLSGGNQQKVVIAKTLAAQTNIIIFDEPTRGVDVGAKQEIYKLMREIIEQGASIIMISSDMEEILGMSDRIIVMSEGKISGELKRDEFEQKKVLELASPHSERM